ncbi:MAG: response regulator [Halanaeroarchaeum sp.]
MSRPIRILLVDDADDAEETASFLEGAHDAMSVATVGSIAAARDRFDAEAHDAVVSDYDLPDGDGLALLEWVRDREPEFPFVLFTGEGSEAVASDAISAGVTDYVQKSTDHERLALLANGVQTAVEGYRAKREVDWHRTVLRNMGEGAYVIDADYVFQFVSFRVPESMDVDAVEWVGEPVAALAEMGVVDRSAVTAIEDGVDVVLAGDRSEVSIEIRPTVPADTAVLELRLRRVQSAADEPLVVGTTRDVTERERRERAVERHNENLADLHRAANRLYGADSLEDCFRTTIDAAVDILGFDWCTLSAPAEDADLFEIMAISADAPLEVGDRPFAVDEGLAGHVYQTREPAIVDDVVDEARGKPTDDAIRAALTVPVGDWGIFQAVSTTPGSFDDRDLTNAELLVSSLRSAIERIERQAELERQNDRLETFADVVSHDLQSPLSVARGRVELAREDCDSPHLGAAARAHDRMQSLIDDLLRLAREGETVESPVPVDLATIARNAWSNVETADATLHVHTDATVRADRSRLGELLENLLRNAVEHGGQSVTVTVDELPDGFYVEDDGDGFVTDDRDAVLESGFTTATDGTGLGLSIVEQIAEGHGWQVTVTDSDDGGARLEFTGVDVD